jgi:hypothetical protein
MIPPWTRGECTQCGQEGYLTRTEAKPDEYAEQYICSECEAFDRGYAAGRLAVFDELQQAINTAIQSFVLRRSR